MDMNLRTGRSRPRCRRINGLTCALLLSVLHSEFKLKRFKFRQSNLVQNAAQNVSRLHAWVSKRPTCYNQGNNWSACAGEHLLYPPATRNEILTREVMCLHQPLCWLQLDWRKTQPSNWECPTHRNLVLYDLSYHDTVSANAATLLEKDLNILSRNSHQVFLCSCKGGLTATHNYQYPFKVCPSQVKDGEPFNSCHVRTELDPNSFNNDRHFQSADALIFGFGASMFEEWIFAGKNMILALWHVANQFRCDKMSSARTFKLIESLAHDRKQRHVIGGNTLYHLEYIRHYTGLNPIYLPATLISAVNGISWHQNRSEFLLNSHMQPPANEKIKLVAQDAIGQYELTDLAKYAGVVYIPYSITNGKSAEQYAMNIPMFAPTIRFARSMINDRTATYDPYCPEMTSEMHPRKHVASPYEFDPNVRIDKDGEKTGADVEFWIAFAEIYRLPCIRYFDSWENMYAQLRSANLSEMSKCMKDANAWRHLEEVQNWCWTTRYVASDFRYMFDNATR